MDIIPDYENIAPPWSGSIANAGPTNWLLALTAAAVYFRSIYVYPMYTLFLTLLVGGTAMIFLDGRWFSGGLLIVAGCYLMPRRAMKPK